MSRRMSCSMTIDAVRDPTKTVTRRHVNTWTTLKPGDRLTLIEKGMGLPKGVQQVVLAEVEIVDVRVEPLYAINTEHDPYDNAGLYREGLGHMTMREFIKFWLDGYGYAKHPFPHHICCRRIEWRYLDGER